MGEVGGVCGGGVGGDACIFFLPSPPAWRDMALSNAAQTCSPVWRLCRRLNQLHFLGIACCVLGIVLVGMSSMLSGSGGTAHAVSRGQILLGMSLIIASQASMGWGAWAGGHGLGGMGWGEGRCMARREGPCMARREGPCMNWGQGRRKGHRAECAPKYRH